MRIHRMMVMAMLGIGLVLGLFLVSQPVAVYADECTWEGGYSGDSWHDPANWSCGLVPDANDTAIVGSGTVNVDSAVTVLNLTHSGGVIQGTGDVTVGGVFTWRGGTQTGTGRTIVDVGAYWDRESGYYGATLDGRTLENRGSATWSSGDIALANAAMIENWGVFEIDTDADLVQDMGDVSTFWNREGATVRKVGSIGTTLVPMHFHNAGLVEVQVGSLQLYNSDSVGGSSGEFLVGDEGILVFRFGTHTLEAGSWVHGAGQVWFYGATVTVLGNYEVDGLTQVSGGTVNVEVDVAVPDLTQSSGVIQGTGDVTVGGVFTWRGGTQTGTGRTIVDVGAYWYRESGSFGATLDGRTLENRGSATWSSGNIALANAAMIENWGLIEIDTDADLEHYTGDTSTFWNHAGATVRKVDGGQTNVEVNFHNDGLLEVAAGRLVLWYTDSVCSSSGEYLVGALGELSFNQGVHTLEAGSWVHGAGEVIVSSATVTVLGNYDFGGLTTVAGTLNVEVDIAVQDLYQYGTIQGGGDVTVGGVFTWNGGTQRGTGRTIVDVGAYWDKGSYGSTLDGRTLENRGSATWSSGNIALANAAMIENWGLIEIDTDADLEHYTGDTSTFWNHAGATVRKVDGGQTNVEVNFHNDGLLEVAAGRLVLWYTDSVCSSSGEYLVGALGELSFNQGVHTLEAGSWVHGAGEVSVSNATVTVLGDYEFGGLTTVAGTVTLDGATSVSLGDLLHSGGTLNVSNEVMISGNLTRNGGTFNAGTGTFTFDGTGEQAIGGTQATPFYNLAIAAGATVVVPSGATAPTVGGILTNDGALKQTLELDNTFGTEEATFAFLNIEDGSGVDKYFGLDITIGAGVEMGTTVVTIQGNQTCGPENTVLRCYEIDPLYDVASTVRFYYRAAEANDNETPFAWHSDGSEWQNVDMSPTRDTTDPEGYWVEADGIDSYSLFALSDDEPGIQGGYLYVKSITFRLLGSGQLVGTVRIVDGDKNAVSGATVWVQWILPDGTRNQQAKTKNPGTAMFRVKADEPGTYTLLVTSVEYEDWLYVPGPGGDSEEITIQ